MYTTADDYSDNTSTTGLLTVGGQVTGNIELPNDKDWFKVSLTAGTTYILELLGASGGGGTLSSSGSHQAFLALYDIKGSRIDSANDGGAGGDPLTSYTPIVSGNYYLQASDLFNTGTGTYTIKATSVGTTADPTPGGINSTSGNDTLYSTNGDDLIDGAAGTDTVSYSATRSNCVITKTLTGFTVSGGNDGADTLTNIERLKFSDTNIALDLNSNAGLTVKILGVVFSAASVSNKQYVGIGLTLLDEGMSYSGLMQTALNAKLGAGFSNDAEINLLYQNLLGILPSTADLNYWTGTLSSGQFSQPSLAQMAAELSINAININLIGLNQTGIEYA